MHTFHEVLFTSTESSWKQLCSWLVVDTLLGDRRTLNRRHFQKIAGEHSDICWRKQKACEYASSAVILTLVKQSIKQLHKR